MAGTRQKAAASYLPGFRGRRDRVRQPRLGSSNPRPQRLRRVRQRQASSTWPLPLLQETEPSRTSLLWLWEPDAEGGTGTLTSLNHRPGPPSFASCLHQRDSARLRCYSSSRQDSRVPLHRVPSAGINAGPASPRASVWRSRAPTRPCENEPQASGAGLPGGEHAHVRLQGVLSGFFAYFTALSPPSFFVVASQSDPETRTPSPLGQRRWLPALQAQMCDADGVCRKGQGLADDNCLQLLLNPFSFPNYYNSSRKHRLWT